MFFFVFFFFVCAVPACVVCGMYVGVASPLLLLLPIDDFVKVREARPPLEGDVCVQELLPLLDVPGGEYLEPVLVEVPHHAGVCGPLLVGVVVRGAAGSHSPGLVRALRRPREDVRAGVAVEAFGETAHHALFDQVALGGEGEREREGDHTGGGERQKGLGRRLGIGVSY